MKKFKSIMLTLALIAVGSFTFVGCGDKDKSKDNLPDNKPGQSQPENPGDSTGDTGNTGNTGDSGSTGEETESVTVEEVKEIILNALKVSGVEDNRNFIVKNNLVDIVLQGTYDDPYGTTEDRRISNENTYTYLFSETGSKFIGENKSETYGDLIKNSKFYYPGEDVIYYYDVISGSYITKEMDSNEYYVSPEFALSTSFPVNLIFTEDYFADAYTGAVKTTTNDGYTIKLALDYWEYGLLTMSGDEGMTKEDVENFYEELSSETGIDYKKSAQENDAYITVTFENNEITKLEFNTTGPTFIDNIECAAETYVSITLHNGNFEAPDWFEIEKFENGVNNYSQVTLSSVSFFNYNGSDVVYDEDGNIIEEVGSIIEKDYFSTKLLDIGNDTNSFYSDSSLLNKVYLEAIIVETDLFGGIVISDIDGIEDWTMIDLINYLIDLSNKNEEEAEVSTEKIKEFLSSTELTMELAFYFA